MAMASSSVAAVTVPLKKYDVFISFRGDDTRAGFTSHLHSALCGSYIQTYIDYRIEKGKEVRGELEEAIKESTLFLVVFSEDYASSTWCLNELVQIMECHKNGQDVIPVFYHIDPSHVRKQTGSYHSALAKHEKHDMEKMQKWKDALCKAANLSGFHSSKYGTESDLIEDITKAVLGKLDHEYKEELTCDFIPNENYSRIIESLMKIGSREVQIIGLWGMGGIGKTTLAAAIFHKVSSQYEGSCFLENVTEESNRNGINNTCKRLLSKLLRDKDLGIDTPKVIPSMVMRRLKRMKAFIVLDDVHTSELLQNLIGVGRGWLGAGSIIIVTTRDMHVLKSGGVDEIHQVKEMNSQNSLRLFSLNAFKTVLPKEGYVELSKIAIDYAEGNPLALKVLGSYLRDKSEIEWDSALAKLKEIPNAEIQRVLRLSYNELDDDKEKNIFLDIACFFKGFERDRLAKILNACDFFADIGIRNLLDKALIRVDVKNCIQMHDLIQEMGKQIVREESPKNPGLRSRLWDPKEVSDVFRKNRGTEHVEAIFLDAAQITHINLSSEAFKNMPNLRLLAFRDHNEIKSISLPSGLDLVLEKLRYFQWDGYPSKTLPLNFCSEMLVELHLQHAKVEKLWDGVQNLPSLEILDLSDSKQLIECPNVSGSPNLKSVIFNGCESLPHVDSSILSLQKLLYLCLDQCKSLKRFSSSTCPPSLRYLTFMGCINLQEFSMPMPGIASIDSFHLSLELCRLNELPSSILHAKNMEGFYCPISDKVADLPENFARGFILTDPVKHERDSSITLRKVMSSPAFLTMGWLFFRQCPSVSEIPDNISLSLALEILLLFHMGIRSLPETIKYLPRLKRLEVGECKMLRSIPALPQSIKFVYVWKCESLETVSGSTGEPSEKPIYDLLLLNCIKLDQLSYGTIFKDAIVEVELKARLFHLDHGGLICLFPATTGSIVQDWFPYHSTKALVTVELPPSFLGFVFYLVLSQGHMGVDGSVGCECYLETSSGKWITIPRFFINKIKFKQLPTVKNNTSINVVTDHVLLWHDASHCKSIMEAVEERKAINDSSSYERLTCRFFIDQPNLNDEVEIKECGLRWIYPSEDQIVEEGRGCKSKRSREIHELESAVQNRLEGSQSDEQEEMVNPTKKLKQCVARNTNEAKENQGKQGDITDPTTRELRRSKREKKANKLYTDFVVQKWRIGS